MTHLFKQTYGGTYDAAGTQALTTGFKDLIGGAAWDGTFGPAANGVTLTATTFDGLTPLAAGVYEVYFSCNWITAAAATVSFAFGQKATAGATDGTPITGAQVRSMSVTETASQYQSVTLHCVLELEADLEVTVMVKEAAGTPTLTYRDAIFYVRRPGATA